MGRFAASYDLVAHEYGWSDEQIGDLTLVRLRQIIASIQMRRYVATREENSRFSWLARNLGTLIAAGYQVEGENPALEHAANLSIDEIEAAALKEAASKPPVASEEERGQAENSVGSFERFLAYTAGGPR